MKEQYREEAWAYWNARRPLEAGRVLYEHMRLEHRPLWAGEILGICLNLIPPRAEIHAVYEIARDKARWKDAHDAFSAVRKLTLEAEKMANPSPIYKGVLYLAENTAKVAYNASGEPAPFDHDAGWWIASCLQYLVDQLQEPEFESKAWSAVSCEKFSGGRNE